MARKSLRDDRNEQAETRGAQVTPLHPAPLRVRVVTAASLFDGHDAAINIMRRMLQNLGAEVIHLGHDRSVDEIVDAAIQEGANAIAVSSYQGGHMEFFRYMVTRLREQGAGGIRVYGGGGGTITQSEIEQLHADGVARIFSPADGRELGLEGMIRIVVDECMSAGVPPLGDAIETFSTQDPLAVGRVITHVEEALGAGKSDELESLRARIAKRREGRARPPIVGFTGTGGAGKSSVVDEVVRRLRLDFPEHSLGVLLVDPTRRRSGGALLGDRIRMNSINGPGIFVRSLATRQAHLAMSATVDDALRILHAAGFDLLLVETAGIGQSDSEIIDRVDLSVYVMTPDYGAPSQLEKVDMLDLADLVVLNKSDRRGARDALRDVRKQWRRNRAPSQIPEDDIPVYPTVARLWSDPGTARFYEALRRRIEQLERGDASVVPSGVADSPAAVEGAAAAKGVELVPPNRARYLAEVAETIREYRRVTEEQAAAAASADGMARALADLGAQVPAPGRPFGEASVSAGASGGEAAALEFLRGRYDALIQGLDSTLRDEIAQWPSTRASYTDPEEGPAAAGATPVVENYGRTLSDTRIPKVAVPMGDSWGEWVRYFRRENLPGRFPFTAGVFPFKREGEEPARMFAGEGGPERTNRRFHMVASGQPAARLSTAFDSVTLYGRDPHERPDIYGKVGNSGVSICTLDDAKKLYSGFDLCDPTTSVSLTINGPAPVLLAFFLNTAIDQEVERHLSETGTLAEVRARFASRDLPAYWGELPPGHDGFGLGLLGIPGDLAVEPGVYERIRNDVLKRIRGTVQADILKEDQAQNTCIFSTEFSLKVMGDIQEYFIQKAVRNFYSVSISGYHIAEAGANPISQLAFTLANGLTYVEYYLARGMDVDDFASSFSFFFSNGLDAEYNVIGRVARRIWAVALRDRYGASERSQKLKYHIQTSGRSLHAQEMAFNDIRTTLQALTALQDNCNSLHTNAYDEAVTTPTEESVRRALAIQLIINRELGVGKNENPIQGSYLIDYLTDEVEEAVLREFERISERGGVLGAMESHYQRGKIQDESLHYESLKHSGDLPIIGVNTFENPDAESSTSGPLELMRSSDEEKRAQLESLAGFHRRWSGESGRALQSLQEVAIRGDNVFAELLETVKRASLGQITDALYETGGRYRRAM